MATVHVDALQHDIAEDAYRQLEKMICGICWKFVHRYGGEFEDWLSEAGELFMDAIHSYNGKASLTTWVWYQLHWRFYTILRKQMKTAGREIALDDLGDHEHSVEEILEANIGKCFTAGLDYLSDSGWELWELIAEPPTELQGELDPEHPEDTWDAIQRYCKYRMQWTWKEMRTAIAELQELCQDSE